ncbi:MAG: AI-2E family transporter [Legionellales bacterium]|jgi:predicted PurR-regulated permease PerM|nr:AI-2E family transporter [Legionellales bacterium]
MEKRAVMIFLATMLVMVTLAVIGLDTTLKPLIAAWALSYFCIPAFNKFECFGIKRKYSAFVILLLILFVILSILFIFIPYLVSELQFFLEDFPQLVVDFVKNITNLLASHNINIELNDFSLLTFIKSYLPKVSAKSLVWVGSAFQSALTNIVYTILSIISVFLFPVFFFYVSIYHKNIEKTLYAWIPGRYLVVFEEFEVAVDDVLGGFLRGQIVIASILACYYSLALSLIDLNFCIVIGFCTGFLSIIPYVGFSLGLFSSLVVAIATGAGFGMVSGILVIFLIAYTVDSFVLTPFLVGGKVGLNSLGVMLSLIIGGNLMGLWGMLFAIPVAALIKRYLSKYREDFTNSSWFLNNRAN